VSNHDDGQETLIAGSQVVTMNATREAITLRSGLPDMAKFPQY
jgi:hypothetical protein